MMRQLRKSLIHLLYGMTLRVESILLIVALCLIRFPFLLTHYLQEDAFIYFRYARNLTDSGVFAFNGVERVNGVTSLAYTMICAILFKLFGPGLGFLLPLLILNSIFVNVGLLLLLSVLIPPDFGASRRKAILLSLAITSLLPTSLLTSYSGMETSLLFVLVCSLAFIIGCPDTKFQLIGAVLLALLPWVRIDAVFFGIVYVVLLTFRNYMLAVKQGVVLIVSSAILMGLNYWYFGYPLPETVVAKALTYQISTRTLSDRLQGGYTALSELLFTPKMKYTEFTRPIWLLGLLVLIAMLWRRRQKYTTALTVFLLLSVALLPFVYGATTSLFPWYLWSPSIIAYALAVSMLVPFLFRMNNWDVYSMVAALSLSLVIFQFSWSVSMGTQEFDYRRGVGLFIASHSDPNASIMLEPIGYIGYFSDRYVHDEVGLVSPAVLDYKRRYGSDWWGRYIRDKHPDFIVERDDILNHRTSDGALIADKDYAYFQANYHLLKVFKYDPYSLTQNPLIQKIAGLGTASSYYVFNRSGYTSSGVHE